MPATLAAMPLPAAPLPSTSSVTAPAKKDFAVGTSIPANMPHAVSVSLPLWSDNVDYEEGRLTNSMETGYPRFFIHRSIQKLATLLCKKFGKPGEACILFPTAKIAERCRDFMRDQHSKAKEGLNQVLPVRIVRFSILENTSSNGDEPSSSTAQHISSSSKPSSAAAADLESTQYSSASTTAHYIFIVFFPSESFPLAKSFWQHTGDGISSRQAERCMHLLEQNGSLDEDASLNGTSDSQTPPAGSGAGTDDMYKKPSSSAGKRFYNRYARTNSAASGLSSTAMTPSPSSSNLTTPSSSTILPRRPSVSTNTNGSNSPTVSGSAATADSMTADHVTYLEERYGRNLPLNSAPAAKLALRRRIAGTLLSDRSETSATEAPSEDVGETGRTGTGVTEKDVYLFPCGMSAIFHAHQLAMRSRLLDSDSSSSGSQEVGKSICFGFPYTDTLKILQKFGPGCHFYGHGVDSDLIQVEKMLEEQQQASSSGEEPRILALFCEFPSNPLLRSPNLPKIRHLADKYNFLVVVDETIGNFVNVEVLPYADILVSSLTKVFSGDANVMGGSMVLNPLSPHYQTLCQAMNNHYEDTYFEEDAIFMERNSRDFIRRIVQIDSNTRAVTSMLWEERNGGGSYPGVVKQVYYPKYQTTQNYQVCRRKRAFGQTAVAHMGSSSPSGDGDDGEEGGGGGGGYGGLFSITFHCEKASEAFYDSLQCAKGPSLGTNLTLACPYTILAHYGELDWAAEFGVEKGLVRVSVGLEDVDFLKSMFRDSLKAAKEAVGN